METTKLTVAKICHEMAGYLSVIKFIQEDLTDTGAALGSTELRELSKNLDLLSLTMEFFRNIYSGYETRKVLLNIMNLRGVGVSDKNDILSNSTGTLQNIICGMLYILMKSSKVGDDIAISGDSDCIEIQSPAGRMLPKSVFDALTNDGVSPDAFNIFAKYISQLATSALFDISLSSNDDHLQVKICKR